jgi:hypothetical protein
LKLPILRRWISCAAALDRCAPGMASRSVIRWAICCVLAAIASAPGDAGAQSGLAMRFQAEDEAPRVLKEAALHSEQPYVLIRLSENRLYLVRGERAIWTAPVATGTGFRLEGAGRQWRFDTPRGVFRVQRKEKDPVWQRPDWYFIEKGLPLPPRNSPLRKEVGGLGTTAIYIGFELALHGTDKPGLVLNPDPEERRVSHGCIRLTNEDARTLYYLVEVGTPVLIY